MEWQSKLGCRLIYWIGAVLMATVWPPAYGATLKVGGTGAALGVMERLGAAFKKNNPTVDIVVVPGLGSSGGRKALMGGALDIAVTSRPGHAVEKADGATARLYGRSPFVFAVQAKNPAANLTIQEIIDIYGGKKITWLGGDRLRLILRPITDSDSELLFGIGPDMEQALKAAHKRDDMAIAMTDEESASLIESTPGGFGSSVLSLIIAEKRRLRFLSVKGVAPSPAHIANGSYPWFKSFYLLSKPDASAAARAFGDFVVSAPARSMLEPLGHWLPDARSDRGR